MNLKRLFFLSFVFAMAFSSCEKSIIDENEFEDDNSNFLLRLRYLYNGVQITKDSLIEKNADTRFYIDDIRFLISNAFVTRNNTDTVMSANRVVLTRFSDTDYLIGTVPPGTYNGPVGFTIGLDSLRNIMPPAFQDRAPLTNESLYLGLERGYKFITIKGRCFDPTDTTGSLEPTLPFEWIIATDELAMTFARNRTFSLLLGNKVSYTASLELSTFFDAVNPVENPLVISDPENQDDMDRAKAIRDNFFANGFTFN